VDKLCKKYRRSAITEPNQLIYMDITSAGAIPERGISFSSSPALVNSAVPHSLAGTGLKQSG
jgi:hypothetical protein